MLFQATKTFVNQLFNKIWDVFIVGQDDMTFGESIEFMQYVQHHFPDPVYGFQSGHNSRSLLQEKHWRDSWH